MMYTLVLLDEIQVQFVVAVGRCLFREEDFDKLIMTSQKHKPFMMQLVVVRF